MATEEDVIASLREQMCNPQLSQVEFFELNQRLKLLTSQ